jgi:hypothetical protein
MKHTDPVVVVYAQTRPHIEAPCKEEYKGNVRDTTKRELRMKVHPPLLHMLH